MNWLIVSFVVIVLFFVSFFVFQNELSVFFVNLTKTKSVSFWSSVSDQPAWLLAQIRFVGLPPECFEKGYNGYHDPLSFQDTAYCADVVCSNGTLSITGTTSSECINPSKEKCSFGLLDKSTSLCVMNSCNSNADCESLISNCPIGLNQVCKEFGRGVYIPATSKTIPAVKVCSCQ